MATSRRALAVGRSGKSVGQGSDVGSVVPGESDAPRGDEGAEHRSVAALLEVRDIVVSLQRVALRLSELGHVREGGPVLQAAVKLSKVRR